ncbi:MAG: DUF3574 domain-containing protein [Pseudorhodoplanes sp.]
MKRILLSSCLGPAIFVVSVVMATLCMPASGQAFSCRANQQDMAVAELMFGRRIGTRIGVTERAWAAFVAREVTPRFPDGLSVVDAAGQWRDARSGRLIREPSKIVSIVLRDPDRDQEHIDRIVAAYKTRFRQDSVGVIIRPACVSF